MLQLCGHQRTVTQKTDIIPTNQQGEDRKLTTGPKRKHKFPMTDMLLIRKIVLKQIKNLRNANKDQTIRH